jgi:hypothetical protein
MEEPFIDLERLVHLRKKGHQSKYQMNWAVKAFNVSFCLRDSQ